MQAPGIAHGPAAVGAAAAFARARLLTDRQAFGRYLRERQVSATDQIGGAYARQAFECRTVLQDAEVRGLAMSALSHAHGDAAITTTWTAWRGVDVTWAGIQMADTWSGYCRWHEELAREIHAKGEGLVYAPVSTRTRYRNNVGVETIHQLVTDCDGVGEWSYLLYELAYLGYAFLAHRSGGWVPGVPRWRVVLPLASPFPIGTQADIDLWRATYATARTVLGAVAWLNGSGFDPSTDAPCHPWYPGYRRRPQDLWRSGFHHHGAALDLMRLAEVLPAPELPARTTPGPELSELESPSLLWLAFSEAGMLGQDVGHGKTAVLCPWNSCHTEPLRPEVEPTSATVIFDASTVANVGAFHCFHSSCGHRLAEEVLAELPADAVMRARLDHEAGRVPHHHLRNAGGIGRMPTRRPGMRFGRR